MTRRLADEPDAQGNAIPEIILSVPRITLVDRGASAGTSISPAEAEALADVDETLAALPSIAREERTAANPSAIEISTYHVINVREAVERDSETIWRYAGE